MTIAPALNGFTVYVTFPLHHKPPSICDFYSKEKGACFLGLWRLRGHRFEGGRIHRGVVFARLLAHSNVSSNVAQLSHEALRSLDTISCTLVLAS
jgi:hypothetical protein